MSQKTEKSRNGVQSIEVGASLLRALADSGLTEDKIYALEGYMKEEVDAINQGKPWRLESFEAGLRKALVLAT